MDVSGCDRLEAQRNRARRGGGPGDEGSDWFSSSSRKLLAVKGRKPSQEASAKVNMLTKREQQVFIFVCQGLNGPKIAAELDVAANTVRNYLSGIYRKLEVHSRAELIVWAKRHDVIT